MSAFVAPSISPAAQSALAQRDAAAKSPASKAQLAAQDFEAVFLNSMVSQMFTSIGGEGPFGGGAGAGVWRSFLAEEYSKSFAKAGGIGIAAQVYQSLLAQQEQALQ